MNNIKQTGPGINALYSQAMPNSQFWTSLESLILYLRLTKNKDNIVDAGYLAVGLNNSLKLGYDLRLKTEEPVKSSTPKEYEVRAGGTTYIEIVNYEAITMAGVPYFRFGCSDNQELLIKISDVISIRQTK